MNWLTAILYTAQSASPMSRLSAVYSGSTSMRGAVTVGLVDGFEVEPGTGSDFEGIIGVEVDTVMVSGRMVPDMVAEDCA